MNFKSGFLISLCAFLFLCASDAMAQQAPSFALLNNRGDMVYKKDYKGVMVISFFASYCKPCKKELPALVDMLKLFGKEKAPTLVLIATDVNGADGEAKDKAGDFLRKIGIEREFLLDIYQTAITKYNPLKNVPSIFLVNRDGWIVFKEIGAKEDTILRLEKAIKALK